MQDTPDWSGWNDYKAGLDKRLDSCKATGTWSGIVFAAARLVDEGGNLWLVAAACVLALGFGLSIYLQLSTGWHYSVLSRRRHYTKRFKRNWLVRHLLCCLAVSHLLRAEAAPTPHERVANRLDVLATWVGTAVYVCAVAGTLLVLLSWM